MGVGLFTTRIVEILVLVWEGKGKVKCTLVQALRLCTGRMVHRRSRGIAILFLDHGTRRGRRVSVTPRPHFTPRKDPVPIVQEVGRGAQSRSGQVRKFSPPPGFDPQTVEPVASRYTDWATSLGGPNFIAASNCNNLNWLTGFGRNVGNQPLNLTTSKANFVFNFNRSKTLGCVYTLNPFQEGGVSIYNTLKYIHECTVHRGWQYVENKRPVHTPRPPLKCLSKENRLKLLKTLSCLFPCVC